MRLTRQRWFGLALMSVSILTASVIQTTTGKLVHSTVLSERLIGNHSGQTPWGG